MEQTLEDKLQTIQDLSTKVEKSNTRIDTLDVGSKTSIQNVSNSNECKAYNSGDINIELPKPST